jgi:hypothetical protein
MYGFVLGSNPDEQALIKFRHISLAASLLRSSEAKKRCLTQNFSYHYAGLSTIM